MGGLWDFPQAWQLVMIFEQAEMDERWPNKAWPLHYVRREFTRKMGCLWFDSKNKRRVSWWWWTKQRSECYELGRCRDRGSGSRHSASQVLSEYIRRKCFPANAQTEFAVSLQVHILLVRSATKELCLKLIIGARITSKTEVNGRNHGKIILPWDWGKLFSENCSCLLVVNSYFSHPRGTYDVH